MRKRLVAIPALTLALGLLGTAAAHADGATPTPAAHSMPGMPGMTMPAAPAQAAPRTVSRDAAIARARQRPVFFAARLTGANEVPVPGKPAVGDPDGSATAVIRLQGDQVTYAFRWTGISAPTLGHIHQGAAGVNGDVKVPLFTTPMPDTATAAAGAVTVPDPAVADAIRTNPRGFYLNLHSKEFPGGALRGQLARLAAPADLLRLVTAGGLRGFMSGDQEVPVAKGPAVGDPDARAVTFVRPAGSQIGYSFAWIGVAPTLGHIHRGTFGVNGPVVVPLFTTPVPSSVFAIAGTATGVDPALVQRIRTKPQNWYANLHSAEFPGGAVRAQLTG